MGEAFCLTAGLLPSEESGEELSGLSSEAVFALLSATGAFDEAAAIPGER
jgi:hypothetical protein